MVFSSVFKDLKNMKTGEFCKTRNFWGKTTEFVTSIVF